MRASAVGRTLEVFGEDECDGDAPRLSGVSIKQPGPVLMNGCNLAVMLKVLKSSRGRDSFNIPGSADSGASLLPSRSYFHPVTLRTLPPVKGGKIVRFNS